MSTEKLCAFPECTRRHDDIELQVPSPEHEAVATISLCWHCADQMGEALQEKLAEWFKNLGLDILRADLDETEALPGLPNEPEAMSFDSVVEAMHQVRDAKARGKADA